MKSKKKKKQVLVLMKKMLVLKRLILPVTAVLLLIASGCIGQAPPTPTPTVPEKLVIGTTDKVTDLDPAQTYDFFTWEIFNNIGQGLYKYKPGTTDLEYGLAEDVKVSEDGLVYTVKLRKGLKFTDGEPLTAQAVKWSFDRVARIGTDPQWFVTDFVDKVEVVDDYTLKIYLKNPVAFYPAVLAVTTCFPISPKSYPENEISPDNTAGGIGPYKITKFVRDQEIVLEANPYYYGEPPKIKTVIVKFFKDSATMRLAIETGEIDLAWKTLTPTDIADLSKKQEELGLQVLQGPGSYIRYIVLNTHIPPLDNKLVRQALAAALDRKSIVDKVFFGTVEPLYSLIPTKMWGYREVFKEKYGDANIELARRLLTQAGYSEANKLKVTLWYTPTHYGPTEGDVAATIKEAWEKTGMIEVEVKSAEWSTYIDMTRKKSLPITLYGWYPDYLDPDNYMFPFLHTGSNRWLGEPYSNPQLDKILEDAQVKPTREERSRLYSQAQDILAEDTPIIPIFQGKLQVVAKKGLKGIILDPLMLLRYYTIYWST